MGKDPINSVQTNPKYMIDFNTYRQMHPSKVPQDPTPDAEMRAQGIDMDSNKQFCVLLPATMLGFGFHDKKWSKARLFDIQS